MSLTIAGSALVPKRDFMPTTPTAGNAAAAQVNLQNVPTVFAGTAGDTAVRLDPAIFRGKVAVFAAAGVTGGAPVGGGNRGGGAGGARGGGAGFATVCDASLGWPNQRGASYALDAAAAAAAARGAARPFSRPGAAGVAVAGAAISG